MQSLLLREALEYKSFQVLLMLQVLKKQILVELLLTSKSNS